MRALRLLGDRRVFVAAVFLFTLLVVNMYDVPRLAVYAHEDVQFARNPTAANAFAIATKHFNARSPRDYDFRRAVSFYKKTEAIDPAYPRLHHQLARIYFIAGDYDQALAQINTELRNTKDPSPNSFYVKGLILGFMGSYENAAKSYERFLRDDPDNWAGWNDYAWVLLRAGHTNEALSAIDTGLSKFPDNPWLHNERATALYDLGRYEEALTEAQQASAAAARVTVAEWHNAYPGNDPATAATGLADLQRSAQSNAEKIRRTIAESAPKK